MEINNDIQAVENNFNLKIHREIIECLPPLSEIEKNALEENILKNGIREPLVTNRGFLVDGHNRYSIARKYNLAFETVEYKFDTKEAVLLWIIDNQLGRRNLTDFSRAELALKQKEYLASESEKRSLANLNNSSLEGQNSAPRGKTAEQLANIANVSRDTIQRTEYIQNNANQEDIDDLRRGEKTINKVYTETRSRNDNTYKSKVEKMTERARQYRKEHPEEFENNNNNNNWGLIIINTQTIEKHIDSIENAGKRQEFCVSVINLCKEKIRQLHIK